MTGQHRAARPPSLVRRIVLPLLIVGLAALGAQWLMTSRPGVPKISKDVTPTFVKVLTAHRQDKRAMLTAYGTVRAHRQLTVQPEVGGRVVRLNPNVVIGGTLKAGEALLQIDPRDYRFAVDEQRASLAKAEFDVQVERGHQAIAKREWDLLKPSAGEISKLSQQLVLRRPHLKEKLIGLEAARSRLRKAQLDLQRTVIHAPFNALVLNESVETGQLVTAQSAVATLVGTDEFRVQVSVPIHQLEWMVFPGADGKPGSRVRVIRERGNGEPVVRQGTVVEFLGDVTQNGRMAQVLVSIRDPLELEQSEEVRRPVLLGEYVRVDIEGPLLRNVTVLPRHAIREGSRVWISNAQGQLEVRPVDIVLSRKDTVLVGQGLWDGEAVIISHVPAAIPGLPVQTIDETPSGGPAGPRGARPEPGTPAPAPQTH